MLEVVEFLTKDVMIPMWEFFINGGYITMCVILFPILRKLVSIMKQFTN